MRRHKRLLLASQSPRRRELLTLLGLPFEVTVADVAEDPLADESPAAAVLRLSQAKALGKPRDAAEALSVLRRLRGRVHTVFSAVTLQEPVAGRTSSDVAETRLAMRTYTDAEMAAYVASGDPLDKAGAYAIQHPGFHPVAELQGCYANVMGLPLCHLTRALRAWNVEPPHDVPAACQDHTGRRCPVYATILAGRPNRQTADGP
jgi:predicted house-cleaning NTP pyrophosphatase (Maf/HAM1 superfamily)